MQHVKMLETRDGASDRITVKTYKEGNVYAISDELAELWLDDNAAAPADASEAAHNDPDLDELTDEELAAKVLELDPDANPGDVAAAIAANREGVLEKVKELDAAPDAPDAGKDDNGGNGEEVDPEFVDLSNKDLVKLAQAEGITIPSTARSRKAKIELIKAARAAKA